MANIDKESEINPNNIHKLEEHYLKKIKMHFQQLNK
jgi:hypothetical protein